MLNFGKGNHCIAIEGKWLDFIILPLTSIEIENYYVNLTPKIFCGGNHNNNVVPMSSAMSWWGIGVGAMAGVVAAPMALSAAGFTAIGVAALPGS